MGLYKKTEAAFWGRINSCYRTTDHEPHLRLLLF